MNDKTVVVTEDAGEQSAADVEAARAAASATQATEAAEAAMALAAVQAAKVTDAAVTEIATFEERLAQCQEQIEAINSQHAQQRDSFEARMAAMTSELTSALKRLETPPAPPLNPNPDQNGGAPVEPPAAPPPEPEPPRRKAHRWI